MYLRILTFVLMFSFSPIVGANELYFTGSKLVEVNIPSLQSRQRLSSFPITRYFGKLKKSGAIVIGTGDLQQSISGDFDQGYILYIFSSNSQLLHTDDSKTILEAIPSPTEDKIILLTIENQLVLIDSKGNKLMWIPKTQPITQASWSPDGTKIVYVGWPKDWRMSSGNNAKTEAEFNSSMEADLFILDLGTQKINKITGALREDYNPIWSPDGKKILFTSLRTQYASFFTIQPDGKNEKQITNLKLDSNTSRIPIALGRKLSWNLSGTSIVYETCLKESENSVWTIQPDGKNAVNLGIGSNPQWDDTGRFILYATPNQDVAIYDVVSKQTKRATEEP